MTDHYHALIWLDHHEAKVYHFNRLESEEARIRSTDPHVHLHHKANTVGSGHAAVDRAFLERIAQAITGAGAILVTGPGSAKGEFVAYLETVHAELARQVRGVETLDHPTDGELVAHARRFFKADDRMHWQVGA